MTKKSEQPAANEEEDFGAAFRDSMEGSADASEQAQEQEQEQEQEQPAEETESSEDDTPSAEPETPESATAADGGVPEDYGTPAEGTPQAHAQPEAQPPESSPAPAAQQPPAQQPQPQQPSAQQPPSQEPEPEPEPEAAKDWTEYLSEEEKKTLSTYDDEWGEVSEAERIRTRAMVRQAEERILGQVNQALNPVVNKLQTQDVNAHFETIRQQHPDFDTLRQGPLQEWVKNMPNSVVRKAAEGVLQQGTTQEVIELIGMYKEEVGAGNGSDNTGQSTGAAPSVPASSQAPAQPSKQQGKAGNKGGSTPPKPDVDPNAVSATAAVTAGSRGADPRGDDPDDFQAGFQETATG